MRIPAISAAAVVLPPTLVRNRGMAQMIPNAKRIAGMSNRELKTLNIGSAPCIATDTIAATPNPIKYWRQRWLTGDGLTMRLSDAGLRRRKTKPLYTNHPLPPALTEDVTRDRSNRLLGALRRA